MKQQLAIRISVLAALCSALGSQVLAQSWPSKPIRVSVPFTAGSGTDIVARIVSDHR